ncbi:HD domain-containing protein [Patescibacteria group bacterium]|nr:HD domain-containing protein [Patescibacteria group bacterium]MBU4023222.1 HD domain-containing protein [Patescibacteria group bacterium]MBU4162184.1 HD domain-containing protein [Patescibacteria group bacterium]
MDNQFIDLEYQRTKIVRYLDSLDDEERRRAFRAMDLAEEQHAGQFRSSGISYIIHPIRVALILVEELGIDDNDLLCAGFLHDVIEDGVLTVTRLNNLFGPEVSRIVEKLTRYKSVGESEEEKLENKKRKAQEISKADENVRIIKLCDVLDNARSNNFIPETSLDFHKIFRWKEETKSYLPIAEKTNQRIYELLNQLE